MDTVTLLPKRFLLALRLDSPAEWRRGFQGRIATAPFVLWFAFDHEDRHRFWNAGVWQRIHCWFLDDDGTIVEHAVLEPYQEQAIAPRRPCRHVIETSEESQLHRILKPGIRIVPVGKHPVFPEFEVLSIS